MKTQFTSAIAALLLTAAGQAFATVCAAGDPANDCAPPSGAILDLAGQTSAATYKVYTTSFVADSAITTLTFAQRSDPGELLLDDVTLNLLGGPNLVINGGFESGTYIGIDGNPEPNGWVYTDPNHAGAPGRVGNSNTRTGSFDYVDFSVGAYDFLAQNIATVIGNTYFVSFYAYHSNGTTTTFRDSGANTVDLLVYALGVGTAAVPEPGSLVLLGLGIGGLALARRRKPR